MWPLLSFGRMSHVCVLHVVYCTWHVSEISLWMINVTFEIFIGNTRHWRRGIYYILKSSADHRMRIHARTRRYYHPGYTLIWVDRVASNANDSLDETFQRGVQEGQRKGRLTWPETSTLFVWGKRSDFSVVWGKHSWSLSHARRGADMPHGGNAPLSILNQIQDGPAAASKPNGSTLSSADKNGQTDQFRWSMNVISNDIYEYFMNGRECRHKFLYKEMRPEYKTNSIKHSTWPVCQEDCVQNNGELTGKSGEEWKVKGQSIIPDIAAFLRRWEEHAGGPHYP